MIALMYTDKDGAEASLRFDVTTEINHQDQAEITQFPVESGVDVADHIRTLITPIELTGYVTNTPLLSDPGVALAFGVQEMDLPKGPSQPQTLSIGGALNTAILGGDRIPTSVQVLTSQGDFEKRTLKMDELLQQLFNDRTEIKLVTPLRTREGLRLTKISAVENYDTDGEGQTWAITLSPLRQTEIVRASFAPKPTELIGSVKKAVGSKATAKDEKPKQEQLKSVLLGIVQGQGGLTGALQGALAPPVP
jgi:hypothetical protein